tara:strand:+ start:1629 stop:2081 length:453 start_codon:yes stop_codon:yes gene_type:complete
MYIKVSGSVTTYPYTIQNLKSDNPNISFPNILTESVLNDFNVYSVVQVENGGDYTKNYVEETPTQSGSLYLQNWTDSDASSEDIETRKNEKWEEVRDIRDSLLSQSDWTQFQDSPITGSLLTDWQTYRQGLRDITSQDNPYSLTWPTKPS